MVTGTLAGLRVVVTREHLEPLGAMLRERGAEPVHLPAIRVIDPADGGAELARHLARLDEYDWLLVTSPNGAERVAATVATAHTPVAVVGAATSARLEELSGRRADLVPAVQHADALAAELLDELDDRPARILLAQADRASPRLAEALRAAGLWVDAVIAYRTETVAPDLSILTERPADAVLLASASAATAWRAALDRHRGGPERSQVAPPVVVVAIGPSTAAAAQRCGIDVTAVAADHSLSGLLDALEKTIHRAT